MGITDKLKRSLNGQDDEEDDGILTQMSSASTLSWSTRIKGFIICFVLGIVFSLVGSFLIFLPNGLIPFVVLYSLGTITSLLSTMFLMGPCNQLKKMFDPTRLICTIVLLVCIVLTILSAVLWKLVGLAILFCILQFLALAWYSISFIPFASREAVYTTVRDFYHHSLPLFIFTIVILFWVFNSIIHYAPLAATLIQLIVHYLNTEEFD